MIGNLPKTLSINGIDYEINSDYRIALLTFEALDDPDLNDFEKSVVAVKCLYKNDNEISSNDYSEAVKQAYWFLDGGDMPKSKPQAQKTIDWVQDESIIFPALNKVAGREIRETDYHLHWWSFLGLFNEVGEGLFSTVMQIRNKKAKHKKLDKWEQEFYRNHKELIDLKNKYSAEQQAEIDKLNKLLG